MAALAVDPRLEHADARDVVGRDREWVAAQDGEVRILAGLKRAEVVLASQRDRALVRVGPQRRGSRYPQVVGAELVSSTRHAGDRRLDRLERNRLGYGRVRRDREGHAGGFELAERVEPLPRRADRLLDALAPVEVVLRLIDGADAGQRHALDLLPRRQSAVFDAVPGVGVGPLGQRPLYGRDDHLDRRRRLRVGRGLQPCSVRPPDQLAVLGRLVVELTRAARVADVAIREVRGPPAERAVGVELDAGEAQIGVAELTDEAHLERLVEQMREEVHRDAELKPSRLGEPQVHVELGAATPARLRRS